MFDLLYLAHFYLRDKMASPQRYYVLYIIKGSQESISIKPRSTSPDGKVTIPFLGSNLNKFSHWNSLANGKIGVPLRKDPCT